MKKKNFIKYFIAFSLILSAYLPVYNFLQYAKNYDFSKSFNTDDIESYMNYFFYKTFNRSLVGRKTITGKDRFLFLGNDYDDVLHKTNGTFRPSNKEISEWGNNLKNLQQWYEDKGIKFLVVIAPNKHTVYKDKLPRWMQYNGKTITDDIVEYAKDNDINLLDLRSLFVEKGKGELLYLKTDTHWNLKGAALAFDKIIAYLNTNLNLDINPPKYSLKEKKRGGGDLAHFLKINTILGPSYETEYEYSFDVDFNVCKGDINRESGQLNKCENVRNPMALLINKQPQYAINSSVKYNKLLLLCDSFASPPSQLYHGSFNTVWLWHFAHINGGRLSKFVQENKPDIVIYQLVERSLYNNIMIAPMPRNQ